MVQVQEIVKIPYSDAMSEAGIAHLLQALQAVGDHPAYESFDAMLQYVAEKAAMLAFRHYMDAADIPYELQPQASYTAGLDPALTLGGRRTTLFTTLVRDRRAIALLGREPERINGVPALVPRIDDLHLQSQEDIYVFTAITGLVTRSRDDLARAVAVGADETFASMINEEDHLRIQVMRSGMQLSSCYEHINRIDNALEQRMAFAFSRRFGYLTACPTNVGTGIRVSVMMHLPALKLTGEIEKVRRAAKEMHLAVRGLFGEGSEALGDLYQISNQTTLGRSEQELLAEFEHTVVPQIIAYEQQARQALLNQRVAQLDDKIYRGWAVLTNARVISTKEVLDMLSHLRMGVNMGRIDSVDIPVINELFLLTQPAHLQRISQRKMDPAARREARATLIRQRLTR